MASTQSMSTDFNCSHLSNQHYWQTAPTVHFLSMSTEGCLVLAFSKALSPRKGIFLLKKWSLQAAIAWCQYRPNHITKSSSSESKFTEKPYNNSRAFSQEEKTLTGLNDSSRSYWGEDHTTQMKQELQRLYGTYLLWSKNSNEPGVSGMRCTMGSSRR